MKTGSAGRDLAVKRDGTVEGSGRAAVVALENLWPVIFRTRMNPAG